MSDLIAMKEQTTSPPPSRATDARQGRLVDRMDPLPKVSIPTNADAAMPTLTVEPRSWVGALNEARWSIQSLEIHIKSELSGPQPGSRATLTDAGSRVRAALETVWKDPKLSSTLSAEGETRDGMRSDLGGGRFDKVIQALQKTEINLDNAHRRSIGMSPAAPDMPTKTLEMTEPGQATAADASAAKPAPASATRTDSTTQQEPIVELVERLKNASVNLTERDAGLVRGISRLAETAAAEPSATGEAKFRTHVAYSLQDTEKALGSGSIPVSVELRSEMTRLAGTSPGLENKQMESLVRSTPEIDDRGLVRDLRRAADSIATLGPNQNSAAVKQHVEALENRVRLAARVVAGDAVDSTVERPISDDIPAATQKGQSRDKVEETSLSYPLAGRQSEARPLPKVPAEETSALRTAASPGDNRERHLPEGNKPSVPDRAEAAIAMGGKPRTAMAQVMDNLRPPSTSSPPPWVPATFAMGDRITKFEQMLGQGRTDQLIRATEKSGVAMMKAIETFSKGPGAEILSKIDAAAGTEPGGLKAVMREMQPGGRYADLRSQFDNALQSDKVFATSYNQVEKTAAQHGKDRVALGADFQAKGLDPKQLDARFQKADEAIGEATERIPARIPGKSVMEELGQKVAEIFNKAIERVRSMFGREAVPEARASASPSMSP